MVNSSQFDYFPKSFSPGKNTNSSPVWEPVFNRGPSPGSSPQLKVLFAGQDIDRSPFNVHVSKALGDPNKVQARGPGLEPQGNVANKPTYFDIYTAGEAQRDPEGRPGGPSPSVSTMTSSLEPKNQTY